MTHVSSRSADVAQRLWVAATARSHSAGDVVWAIEQLFSKLRAGLLPWVGGHGYRALFDRAIGEVEQEHPLLAGLSFLASDDQPISASTTTRTTADRAHAASEVEAVTVGLITALIDAFGRFVGETLAVRLVDQIDFSPTSDAVSIVPRGAPDVQV